MTRGEHASQGQAELFATSLTTPEPDGDEAPAPAARPSPLANDASRRDEIAHRLRVLLHMRPLFRLHQGDAKRDESTRHYDALALALHVFDELADHMGLEREADSEVVAHALAPVLAAMDSGADVPLDSAQHARMTDSVLAGLRNDANARRMFREDYTAIDENGQARRRAVEFRLVTDVFHPAGGTVLRLSDEACNLYLRLLDLDIEDAQAAAEAVVESQLARGRLDEAVHSARQARIQSVRLHDKLLAVLRATRRDVDRVDWRVAVPTMLEEANGHLERRLRVEAGILVSAEERLEQLDADERRRRAVVEVMELIRDCQSRHLDLHDHLMRARNVFLEAQARQSFTSTAVLLPDLLDEVLAPLMAEPARRVVDIADRSVPLLVGARPPELLSLSALVTWMLQPRKARSQREVPVEPIDPADLSDELARYPAAERAFCQKLLAGLDEPHTLTELFADARARGASDSAVELLGLMCLRSFAREARGPDGIAVESVANEAVRDPWLCGDELRINPRTGDHDRT